jgi:hypothetical protein
MQVLELDHKEVKTNKAGFLPFLLVIAIDAAVLGFMSGYIYESYTSDH